jgi:orotate phosphoribosyltransferase
MTAPMVVAEKLLQINAVKLSPSEPFTWASGIKSPIYCDNRKILSFPAIRDFIKSEFCNKVFEDFKEAELIAGVATAGIPWGMLIADQLKLPFVYVRPKPKDHGMGKQIEGDYKEGQRTVVIEDLVSTGKSSLEAIDALVKNGLKIEGMVSIFTYGFEQAKNAFDTHKVAFTSLTDYSTLLELALQKNYISQDQLTLLNQWRLDPSNWSAK